MIIFDLEWNRGYDTKSLDEILQIGAVRIAGLGQPVTDTFNVYIRPKVHKKFGPGAKKLPDLCKSVESDVDFARGLSLFLAWCGGERELAAWGGDDFKALRQNCEYWKLPVPDFPKQYDLQRAFGHTFGEDKRQISLQPFPQHRQPHVENRLVDDEVDETRIDSQRIHPRRLRHALADTVDDLLTIQNRRIRQVLPHRALLGDVNQLFGIRLERAGRDAAELCLQIPHCPPGRVLRYLGRATLELRATVKELGVKIAVVAPCGVA